MHTFFKHSKPKKEAIKEPKTKHKNEKEPDKKLKPKKGHSGNYYY
jgi:hypothetical protein